MLTEWIEVNGTRWPVYVYLEHRHSTRASIRRNAIYIRIPSFLPREERFKELLRLKSWASKQIEGNPNRFKPEVKRIYSNGELLLVGPDAYTLHIQYSDKLSSSARIEGDSIKLHLSSNLTDKQIQDHASSLISRCIAGRRLPALKEKISELNKTHFNLPLNKIFFKNHKSRWGSCSEAGNINISTRLLFAPDDVLEYVCLHELAHLKEQNHSERFWELVRGAMPAFEEKEQWLKKNGGTCTF